MTLDELFDELKSLATQLNLPIRFEQGDFNGGLCVVNDEKVIILNKKAGLPKKISTLAVALSQCQLEGVFVKPALREAIDDELAKLRAESIVPDTTASPAA